MPVVVAAGSAYADDAFEVVPLILTLIGSLAVQIAANFANDVSDATRGADPADRIGPPRMVATGVITSRAMWRACLVALAVAAICGALIVARVGPIIIWIALGSLLALLTYVGGPWPYGYRGWGELAVFAFFGLVATAGARLSYDGQAPGYLWRLAVPVGLLAAAILVANNLRDLTIDERVGKRTLAVMLGERTTRWFYAGLLWGAMLLTAALAALELTPYETTIAVAATGLIPPLTRIASIASAPKLYTPLLAGTARLHLIYGALLAASLAFTRF